MPRPERLAALFAIAACLGCGAHDSRAPGADRLEEDDGALDHPGRAAHYGRAAAGEVGLTEEEVALLGPGGAKCEVDSRLVFAARRHARELAAGGAPDRGDGIDHIRFAVLAAGCADYDLQPISIRLNADGLAALRGFVDAHGEEWTHCGVGVAGKMGDGWAVLIGAVREVELEAIPLVSNAPARFSVAGRTARRGQTALQVFLGTPDGGVLRPDLAISIGGGFSVHLAMEAPGRYDLEIQMDTGQGAETVILLPLYVGVAPEPGPVVAPDATNAASGRAREAVLLELINTARRRAGAPPLVFDARLDSIAAAHSADIASGGFFGHRSPRTGELSDRLRANGLTPSSSAENVARSGTLHRAHRNLLASPSHRLKIVDRAFTHVGLGVVDVGGEVVVTEVFAQW